MNFKEYSILTGLIPPEHEAKKFFENCCSHAKVESPSIVELELARKPHRWVEMRKLHKDFFNAVMQKVTEYEIDLLKLFELPDIEEVRASLAGEDIPDKGKFVWNENKSRGFTRIIKDWQKSLIGHDVLAKQTNETEDESAIPIYNLFMLTAFSVGLKKTMQMILKAKPDQIDESVILQTQVLPSTQNLYLQEVVKSGGERIQTKLGRYYLKDVRKQLIGMAKDGKSPLIVGRFLHKAIGEGQAWYWNRITRSESSLAVNGAFNAQSKSSGVNYEQWSAAPNACPICTALDGHVWRLGEGPEPVTSTHPHCTLWNTKVFTSKGWVFIKNIKINDLVLTHKGRFRKVTHLHKHLEKEQDVVTIYYKNQEYANGKGISYVSVVFTENHPVLINGQWKNAGEIKAGDNVRLLATECNVCNKLIPYSRWRNKKGEISKYCSQICSSKDIVRIYGGKYLTKEFHKIGQELIRKGQHHFQTRKNIISLANRANSKIKYNTKPERILSNALKRRGINHKRQVIIKRPELRRCGKNGMMNRFYKIDLVVPDYKIAIECNGEAWHRDKRYDKKRQEYIDIKSFWNV